MSFMDFGKRGVSAVVASVLLILLVMVLTAIIFSWARGFVEDKTGEVDGPNNKMCEYLDFVAVVVSASGNFRDVDAINRGNVDIDSFEYKMHYKDGNSEVFFSNVSILAGSSLSITEDFSGIVFSDIEKIEIFPALGFSGSKKIVCRDESIYLSGWSAFA